MGAPAKVATTFTARLEQFLLELKSAAVPVPRRIPTMQPTKAVLTRQLGDWQLHVLIWLKHPDRIVLNGTNPAGSEMSAKQPYTTLELEANWEDAGRFFIEHVEINSYNQAQASTDPDRAYHNVCLGEPGIDREQMSRVVLNALQLR